MLESIRSLWLRLNDYPRSRTGTPADITMDSPVRTVNGILRPSSQWVGFSWLKFSRGRSTGHQVWCSVSSVSFDNGIVSSIWNCLRPKEPDPRSWNEPPDGWAIRAEKIQVKVAEGNEEVCGFYNSFGFVSRMMVLERGSTFGR